MPYKKTFLNVFSLQNFHKAKKKNYVVLLERRYCLKKLVEITNITVAQNFMLQKKLFSMCFHYIIFIKIIQGLCSFIRKKVPSGKIASA